MIRIAKILQNDESSLTNFNKLLDDGWNIVDTHLLEGIRGCMVEGRHILPISGEIIYTLEKFELKTQR
jgi:hypothetical protein